MKFIVPLVAAMVLVAACSRQHSDSASVRRFGSAAGASTNQPGKAYITKDGFTFYVGSMTVNGTNVLQSTNVQVRIESSRE